MMFKQFFEGQCDQLQSEFKKGTYTSQNSADIGELCEKLVKTFLATGLEGSFHVARGGKVINVDDNMSSQFDVIVTVRNALRLFEDKGLYPIETVAGLFSITSKLTRDKLDDCLKEFRSVPRSNLQLLPLSSVEGLFEPIQQVIERWKFHHPYKCVWAFDGHMNTTWAKELSALAVTLDTESRSLLPDLIFVNKQAMMVKLVDDNQVYYDFRDFTEEPECYFSPLSIILNRLHLLASWQRTLFPTYVEYFRKDVPDKYR